MINLPEKLVQTAINRNGITLYKKNDAIEVVSYLETKEIKLLGFDVF